MRLQFPQLACLVAGTMALPITAVSEQKADSPKSLYKSAVRRLAEGNAEAADQDLTRCLEIELRNKRCRALLETVRRRRLSLIFGELSNASRFDLPRRRMLVDQALRLDPAAAWARREDLENQQTFTDVVSQTKAFLSDAAKAEATPELLNNFPEPVQPYVPFVPLLGQIQRDAILSMAKEAVEEAQRTGEYKKAVARLLPYRAVAGSVLADLAAEVIRRTTSDARQAVLTANVPAMAQALERLASIEPLIDARILADTRRSIVDGAIPAIQSALPANFPKRGAASARVLQEMVMDGSPAFAHVGLFPWETLAGGPPRLAVAIKVATPGTECESTFQADTLLQDLSTARPDAIDLVTTEGALTVNLVEPTCRVATETSNPQAVPSTYVASYQQVQNPDYVRLQSALQVALAEAARAEVAYAANPNFGTGFARGLAQGRAIRLQRELADTPPFGQVPVELAYEAIKFKAVRTATASVAVKVHDPSTNFTDAMWLQESAEATAEGLRGTMEKDSRGLRNQDPDLPLPESLLKTAAQKIGGELGPAFRSLVARALFARAVESQRKGDSIDALGYLLLAQDCKTDQAGLPDLTAILGQARRTPLTKIAALQLPRLLPAAAVTTAAVSTAADTSPRLAVIRRALASVVTIDAGAKAGSGFFVSSRGLVLTNAHVVDGAGKIVVRTNDSETFLASVVELVRDSDLALLRIQANETPALSLASDDLPPVGTDVFAVGSPLGLEGTVTRGILSAIRRKGSITLLQIDAPINPGNSGGPLLSEDGRVLGVNTIKLTGGNLEGMGFAVSITEVRKAFGPYLTGQ
jgi:S1-C subfamily serine protease